MGVIATPFLVLPILGLASLIGTPDWTVATAFSFAAVFGLGLWLILEVSTVRIHLTADELCLKRYWRTRWCVERDHALLERGGVGDVPVLPGFRVFDTHERKQIGAIALSQFPRDDLERLERVLSGRPSAPDGATP